MAGENGTLSPVLTGCSQYNCSLGPAVCLDEGHNPLLEMFNNSILHRYILQCWLFRLLVKKQVCVCVFEIEELVDHFD